MALSARLSGGQRQRILLPARWRSYSGVIADESVLACSIRAQIINLMLGFAARDGIAFLCLLPMTWRWLSRISHRVAGDYRVRIVEIACAARCLKTRTISNPKLDGRCSGGDPGIRRSQRQSVRLSAGVSSGGARGVSTSRYRVGPGRSLLRESAADCWLR